MYILLWSPRAHLKIGENGRNKIMNIWVGNWQSLPLCDEISGGGRVKRC